MIINCKNCCSKFRVNALDIPRHGRKLKCGVCSNTWFEKSKNKPLNKYFDRKIYLFLFFVFFLCTLGLNIKTDELDITALEINIDKNTNTLSADGNVEVLDQDGNIIITDKAKYFKNEKKVFTYENSKATLNTGYEITSDEFIYDNLNKIVSSNELSNLIDLDGNSIALPSFKYSLLKKILSSKGNIKIDDNLGNEYFLDEMYVDTENKRIVGSGVKANLNPDNLDEANENNEPRFVANSALITKNKSIFDKGVFTMCKKRGNKCPPWSLKSKTITHDKLKKTIYYDNSILRVYDIPVFYFPKFFHPDPSVKRQSGILQPSLTDSGTVGTGLRIPYFWAIADHRDFTFTPKIYTEEHPLLLGEYRHVTKNSSLLIDTGFTQGYKNPSGKQTDGSRNHFFLKSKSEIDSKNFDTSNLFLNLQRASNDTYFRIHDINTKDDTGLVDISDTTLNNDFEINLKKGSMYLEAKVSASENMRDSSRSRYEYLLPDISFRNALYDSKNFGSFDWSTKTFYKEYQVDKKIGMVVNDIIWNSNQSINGKGIVTEIEGILKNTNYDSENTSEYKTENSNHELNAVIALTNSLPMEKEHDDKIKTLTPKIMLRYAPGQMRNLQSQNNSLTINNLFSLNKTGDVDIIETGTSAILGIDYNIDTVDSDGTRSTKALFSLGQALNLDYNDDMSKSTSLDKKTSDLVGSMNFNLFNNSSIDYNFSIDNNFDNINYSEISSEFNIGKVTFNLDYLEEQQHVGNENYVNSGLSLDFNEFNTLEFKTRKNFRTNSTEFYNLNYQYKNDCLRAGIEFKRDFYEDKDVEPTDTLRFTLTIIPFSSVESPSFREF